MEDEDEDSQLRLDSKPASIGTAEVFLRPLRFMFDVETQIAIAPHHSVTSTAASSPNGDRDTDDPLGRVHVHLMIATRPPLIERQQANGFLRAVRASGAQGSSEFDDIIHDNGDEDDTKLQHIDLDTKDEEEGELRGLKGSFAWLLVRMQQSQDGYQQSRKLWDARVQCQVTSASESYLLPIDHTNVIKLLVTDELLDQVNTKTLEFTFISPPPPPSALALPAPQNSQSPPAHVEPPASPPAIATTAKSEAKDHHVDGDHDTASAKSYKAELNAKELERARVAELEHEAKAAGA